MARQLSADKYSVPALARALEILDILSMSGMGLTKMDVARQVQIPYSTAFNLLNTMEQHGYVRKDQASGRYYLGLKLLSLGRIQIRDLMALERKACACYRFGRKLTEELGRANGG